MTIKQDIDKLFKQGLSNYSENPPSFIWDSIAGKLNNKKTRVKRNIRYSIAASLAILLSFGAGYMLTTNDSNNLIVGNKNTSTPIENIKIEVDVNSNNNNNPELNINKELSPNDSSSNKTIAPKSLNPETEHNPNPKHTIKEHSSSGTLSAPMFADKEEFESDSVVDADNNKHD